MQVLFVCSQGMSSQIAVNALEKEAKRQGESIVTGAVGTQALENELRDGSWDVVMVAPQIRHRFKDLKAIADAAGRPCALIEPQGYTPLGGPKLLAQVRKLLAK